MDPGRPRADAVLLHDDRIAYVGDTAQAEARAGDRLTGRALPDLPFPKQ